MADVVVNALPGAGGPMFSTVQHCLDALPSERYDASGPVSHALTGSTLNDLLLQGWGARQAGQTGHKFRAAGPVVECTYIHNGVTWRNAYNVRVHIAFALKYFFVEEMGFQLACCSDPGGG